MKRAILLLLISVLCACSTTTTTTGTEGSKPGGKVFSDLQPGDRVHVRFASNGCFHSDAYDFEFERGSRTTVRVARLSRSWNAARKSMEYHSPQGLGMLTLSGRDLAGLDGLVRFYRGGPDGGCTTRDEITFERFRGSDGPGAAAVSREHYVDGSCEVDRLRGVVTLPGLVRRLERESQ